ncbi:expressed unknown protein [Seminavis robusta]|uniref:Uncharacterized protein n=1 Tax=Seminavis robusta TaxID=568900 RepID=A0A9N8DNV3_9STRA|nr:expressed unknown protein [Seminavis robusta]|eukprot:Sro159_g071770.1 n/a (466) ;mRNA; f:30720-32117
MADPSTSPAIAQALTRIFAEDFPVERLAWRRPHRPLTTKKAASSDRLSKKQKTGPKDPTLLLQNKELIRNVTEFLDPFEIQAWACCCKATRSVCNPAFQLDRLFALFSILKEDADRLDSHIQETTENNEPNNPNSVNWMDVLDVFMEALMTLQETYGPFHPHPLHASLVGEIIMDQITMPPNGHFQPNEQFLSVIRGRIPLCHVWSGRLGGLAFSQHLVLGDHDDYFIFTEEYWTGENAFPFLREHSPEDIEAEVPPGPARILLQEKRIPFINLFTREQEEHTEQMGWFFPSRDDDKTDQQDSSVNHLNLNEGVKAEIFCMNYQDLPEQEGDLKEFHEWYQTCIEKYADCTSMAQAWCQRAPVSPQRRPWDQWTQLVRAAWLNAHNIAPFEDTPRGRQLWEQVMELALKADGLSKPTTGSETREIIRPLDINTFQVAGVDEARAKECLAVYLWKDHKLAKASDYV